MKIGFIGDLHMDYNTHHDFPACFARICENLSLDTIVFCGDTTTGAFDSLDFYDKLSQRVSTKILEIPGNHELYCTAGRKKRQKNEYLCFDADEYMELMMNHPLYSLCTHPIVHGEWAVIGSPSWYDFSLHKKFAHMTEATKRQFLRRNPEYKYVLDSENNPFINEKITAQSLQFMEKQLKTIRERPGGDRYKICSVIHMLPRPELYKQSHVFNTTIAFMGSKYYAELYEKYHVDICVCAHSHQRMELTINGVRYINVSLGHNFKWKNKTSLYKEILDTMFVLEI
ncbi:MAG: metallophosphoesterase [Peptococcaceae bacterium]|nr:metallophosphoesterase [Peptococcaceae bacterium]